MRVTALTLFVMFLLCIPFSHLVAGEKHSTRKPFGYSIEDVNDSNPYWDHRYRRYPYPYPSPYIYPYYPPYPPPSYWRYREYETSPYDNLTVKQAGRITIVAQPLDARVYVDGFQLKRKEDLTCEIGLLTGIHQIEVKREGYKSQTLDVLVEAGKSIPLTIELEKTKQ